MAVKMMLFQASLATMVLEIIQDANKRLVTNLSYRKPSIFCHDISKEMATSSYPALIKTVIIISKTTTTKQVRILMLYISS